MEAGKVVVKGQIRALDLVDAMVVAARRKLQRRAEVSIYEAGGVLQRFAQDFAGIVAGSRAIAGAGILSGARLSADRRTLTVDYDPAVGETAFSLRARARSRSPTRRRPTPPSPSSSPTPRPRS